MLKKIVKDRFEKHFLAGKLDKCRELLAKELEKHEDAPFHRTLKAKYEIEMARRFARKVRPFYSRQAKLSDVAAILLEFQDIASLKRWTFTVSAYEEYDGLDCIDLLGMPLKSSSPELLYLWGHIERGFATHCQKGKFEEAAELAKLYLYVIFFSMLRDAAPDLKKISVPVVVVHENAPYYMEVHDGKITTALSRRGCPEYSDKFGELWGAICDRVEEHIGEPTDVRYSAYGDTRGGLPLDNLDEIAIKGKAVIVGPAKPFWGGEGSKDYQSDLIENPTWLQLCALLHEQIKVTGDRHHVFIEGVHRVGFTKIDGKRVSKYELVLGS